MSFEFENVGELHIIYGSMFSGKSSALVFELTKLADTGYKCLYINHSFDERETEQQDTCVTTHSSGFRKLSDKIAALKISDLSEITEDTIKTYDAIGIDEGQFFDMNIVSIVKKWVLEFNLKVVIASLDSDFKLNSFGNIHNLICICNTVTKLKAKCTLCQHKYGKRMLTVDAYYTAKIGGDKNQIIDAGGTNKYTAVCLSCWKINNMKTS